MSRNTPERLDALEAVAVRVITNTYGPMLDDEARGWIQKGIEGMRYAVATEGADDAQPDSRPEPPTPSHCPTERTC